MSREFRGLPTLHNAQQELQFSQMQKDALCPNVNHPSLSRFFSPFFFFFLSLLLKTTPFIEMEMKERGPTKSPHACPPNCIITFLIPHLLYPSAPLTSFFSMRIQGVPQNHHTHTQPNYKGQNFNI